MKILNFLLLAVLIPITLPANEIYHSTYGDKNDPAIIFLHGGPGYNSANFEGTTAKTLSEKGFFVITYDRRGEGRSSEIESKYTFKESIDDINSILEQYKLNKVSLIGHSFGGMLAIKYAEQEFFKIDNIYLVGAPLDLQASFKNIIQSCEDIYKEQNDQANLNYINMLKTMDSSTVQYSSFCFMHAMQNGFYTPSNITEEAKQIYNEFGSNELLSKLSIEMTQLPPQAFWKNENYTTLNLSDDLKDLVDAGLSVYGIYGKDDGLYNQQIVKNIASIIGDANMFYIDNASHSVYIDQQNKFLSIFTN